MAYGTDPDPYGAIPPYQVPLNTYNPNYPGIPGINNSFAPVMGGMPHQQDYGMDGMMHQFGMMQPFTNQQGSAVRSSGYQPVGRVVQKDFARVIAGNKTPTDWDALGVFYR